MARTTVTCASCHAASTATVAPSAANGHNDGNIDVTVGNYPANKTKGSPVGTCSNISCHNSPVTYTGPAFAAPTVTWGANLNCDGCHGYPQPTVGHATVAVGSCYSCHDNVVAGGTNTTSTFVDNKKHVNGTVEGGKCNSCHGYPPVQTLVGLVNYSSAKLQNYSGGGGVHAVAGHLNPFIRQTAAFGTLGSASPGCVTCHPSTSHNQAGGAFLTANVQVTVDPQFKFDKNSAIVYNRTAGAKSTGTCSNVSCHFKPTPNWSTQTYTQSH
jgi:predicted CxxxxCH...CXXCH cytochrome family protein